MRAFRIGYVFTLSFLLILSVLMLTLGYYRAPVGPKAPEYPTSTTTPAMPSTTTSDTITSMDYTSPYTEYEKAKKQYDQDQKTFLQDKIVPYARNVVVFWVLMLVLFEVAGVILVKQFSEVVGAGFAFSGVWAVIFGPFGGILWFVNSMVSSFGNRANQTVSADIIFQSVGIMALLGVIAMTATGFYFFRKAR